jgi:hypothetical protein
MAPLVGRRRVLKQYVTCTPQRHATGAASSVQRMIGHSNTCDIYYDHVSIVLDKLIKVRGMMNVITVGGKNFHDDFDE